MLELLNFMFQSFWHFIGCAMVLGWIGTFLLRIWNRFWRHWNIRKHGWPPDYCDADGDFKRVEKEEN